MSKKERPLSPHLTIYKPQISSILSIFHRITGVILFGALSLLSWYLILTTFGGCNCECLHMLVDYAVFGASFAFFYHFSTGLRHLVWDTGTGLSKKAVKTSGYMAVSLAILLAVFIWLI